MDEMTLQKNSISTTLIIQPLILQNVPFPISMIQPQSTLKPNSLLKQSCSHQAKPPFTTIITQLQFIISYTVPLPDNRLRMYSVHCTLSVQCVYVCVSAYVCVHVLHHAFCIYIVKI